MPRSSQQIIYYPFVPLNVFPLRCQNMSEDVFYSVENLRLGVGEIEAFLIDVLAGEPCLQSMYPYL